MLPCSIPLTSPLNVSPLQCKVGVVSILAFIARGTAVAYTDLVSVRPTIAYGFPGCACGFSVVGAPAVPSTAAPPVERLAMTVSRWAILLRDDPRSSRSQ